MVRGLGRTYEVLILLPVAAEKELPVYTPTQLRTGRLALVAELVAVCSVTLSNDSNRVGVPVNPPGTLKMMPLPVAEADEAETNADAPDAPPVVLAESSCCTYISENTPLAVCGIRRVATAECAVVKFPDDVAMVIPNGANQPNGENGNVTSVTGVPWNATTLPNSARLEDTTTNSVGAVGGTTAPDTNCTVYSSPPHTLPSGMT
jgi:hypothetical protein